tara:strand:- start:171 stop:2258 length:2088 start_codon:yes stop_codon:yes gene_type:complete
MTVFETKGTSGNADFKIVDKDNNNDRAALQVQGNAGAVECLFVGSAGHVGIGTTSPDMDLHINTSDDGSVMFSRGGGNKYSIEHDTSQFYLYNRNINKNTIEVDHTGPVTINEDGHSTIDFRVEGDSDTHLIFTDASADKVGIGDSSPSSKLDVAGDINSTGQYKVDGTTVINTDGNFEVHDTRSDTPSNDIGLKGVEFEFKQNTTNGLNDGGTYNGVMTFQIWNDSSGGNINRLGFTNTSQIYLQSQQIGNSLTGWRKILQKDTNSIINLDSISGSAADTTITGSNNITIRAEASSGGTTRKSEIEMYNSSDGSMQLRTDNASTGGIEFHTEGSKRMEVERGGNVNITNTLDLDGSVNMTGAGTHTINTSNDIPLRVLSTDGTCAISIGDNSTTSNHNKIQSVGNVMELTAANSKRIELSSGAIVFNQDSDDVDFRVESNGSTHMLFIDGNLDRMGVGTDFGTGGAANELKTLLTLKPKGACDTTTLSAAVSGGLSLNAGAGLDDNDFYPAISFMHDDGNTSTQNRTTAVIVARATETYDDGNDCGTELEFYTKPKNTNGLPNLNMILEDDGDLHVEGDVVAFSTTTSDKKLKDNVVNIENPLDKITKLRGVEFDWNATSRKGQHDIGLIAQEVEKVIPDVVREKPLKTGDFANNEKTYKTVDYEKIVAVLVESTKEQQKQIEDLKKEIKELKK